MQRPIGLFGHIARWRTFLLAAGRCDDGAAAAAVEAPSTTNAATAAAAAASVWNPRDFFIRLLLGRARATLPLALPRQLRDTLSSAGGRGRPPGPARSRHDARHDR